MKPVIGLDPGTTESAFVAYNGQAITCIGIIENEQMVLRLAEQQEPAFLVVEEFESFGMAVGREVFRTIRWTGRFEQAYPWPNLVVFMPRRQVKQHICHTARATDANIRQELLDRFGGQATAIGSKRTAGPLYGLKSHLWSALALAVTYHDLSGHLPPDIRPRRRP